MPLILRSVFLPLDYSESDLSAAVLRFPELSGETVRDLRLYRRSIDARGREPKFVAHISVDLAGGADVERNVAEAIRSRKGDAAYESPGPAPLPAPGTEALRGPVLVVGAGPAGLQAAWRLAAAGYRPIVLERGKDVKERAADVAAFRSSGVPDPDSNVAFGLGGAGLYSDGKIGTRVNDSALRDVYRSWVDAGAPPDILVEAKPHIGTDGLHRMLPRFRKNIEGMGGVFRFGARVESLVLAEDPTEELPAVPAAAERSRRTGRVTGAIVHGEFIAAGAVVLATGSSARDLLPVLFEAGVDIVPRCTLVGVRIEQAQEIVDRAQYGPAAGHPALDPAEYFLKHKPWDRSLRPVHSFCMCPGGTVLAVATEPHGLTSNGMSDSRRSSGFANAAILAPVRTDEFLEFAREAGPAIDHNLAGRAAAVFAGYVFQRALERLAFERGGGDGRLPAMRASDFIRDRPSRSLPDGPRSDWRSLADCRGLLPGSIEASVIDALKDFNRRNPGFAGERATVYGTETRSGSTVQIRRDERGVSLSTDGLYPAGEGAGYAGGIASSALDGLKAANRIIARFSRPD